MARPCHSRACRCSAPCVARGWQGETRAEKRQKEKDNQAKMEAEMRAYQEHQKQKAATDAEKEFGGARSSSSARNRIATPGMRSTDAGGSDAGGSAVVKKTPKRRFGV
jgi:hypothetical protein